MIPPKSETYIEDVLPRERTEYPIPELSHVQHYGSWFKELFRYEDDEHLNEVRPGVIVFNLRSEDTEKNMIRLSFSRYAEAWRDETSFLSSPAKKHLNENYLKIISLGKAAIPFILAELRDRPSDWFLALRVLSGENPVQGEDASNFQAVVNAWLRWGEANAYL